MSAAGRGQPPQAAARRPALRKRREGCNDRTIGRIDCPVVPERPPSGQLVSGSGQAGVGGHAGVRGGLTPGQMCSASGRLPPTVTSVATGVGLAAAPRTDNSCSAWPDTGREPPRPGPATHRVPRASGQGLRCGPRAPSDLRLCSHHRITNGGRPGLLTQARTPRTAT
jgi:hypothetical protein